jgi:hypothetical protein
LLVIRFNVNIRYCVLLAFISIFRGGIFFIIGLIVVIVIVVGAIVGQS